jgi:pyruvate/2-oxoglutarate dehydrogenase complex dihydrolipoamide acyltransferase (E2) component
MKVMSIVAWVLVGILLIGAGTLAFLNSQQSGRAAGLRDALAQVGATAGVQDLAPDALKDAAALPDILQKVQTAIQATQQELASTKETLAAVQTEASGAKTEVTTLKQSFEEQTDKVTAATKDLAAKDEALAAAKTASEKAAEAMKAVEQQKTELEGNLESVKTRMTEETARLQAELDAALQQVAALETAQEEAPAEAGAAAAAEPQEPRFEEDPGQVVGVSEIFTHLRYSEPNQTLYFKLRDGQTLTYRDIPRDVVDNLIKAPNTIDKVYLFRDQDKYKSIPPDSIVLRKYWKWLRRHPGRVDVYLSQELAAAAPVEAVPVEAEAPAEASAPIK